MTEKEIIELKIENSALSEQSKQNIIEKLSLFEKMECNEATAEELIRLHELFT